MYNEIFPTLWRLKSTGPETFDTIRNIGTRTKCFTVFLTLLTILSATLALPWFGDEYELYVTIKVFEDCLDKYATFFSVLFYISLYHGGFTIVLNVLTFMYLTLHLFFQCILLKKELDKLGVLPKFHKKDKFYQDTVKTKLVFCIKHHQRLQK